ncbi:MAG: aromatic amino acid lyase [Pseudomonadota bacterium]
MDEVLLGAGPIGPRDLWAIAEGRAVRLSTEGLARMAAGRAVIAEAEAAGAAVYGVTTGLGPRVTERLSAKDRQRFAAATLRGRAHALGPALAPGVVRAAMAIRIQGFLTGAVGVRPGLAEFLAACLNARLTPVLGETGSIGAADLLWGGSFGAALIGEGEMDTPEGRQPADTALRAAGLAPWQPASREGLALASHSSVTAALAALGLARLSALMASAEISAALVMEGFRANPSPLDSDVLALSPKPGQDRAAEGLRRLLHGSHLHAAEGPRRLQDPLSIRNIVQVHGAVFAALAFLEDAVAGEVNGLTDNPVVLTARGAVRPGGSYLSPHLAIAATAAATACCHLAAQQVARMGKLLAERFSGLPSGLTHIGAGGAGLGALLKAPEALFAEIHQCAQPAPIYPSLSADGLEDTVTHAAIPAKALHGICDRLERIVAIEMIVAAQAIELRGVEIAPRLRPALGDLRALSPRVEADRALTREIEAVAHAIAEGRFTRTDSPGESP